MRCPKCHRPLKDPESISRGMGAKCHQKMYGKRVRIKRSTVTVQDWEQVGLFEGVDNDIHRD